MNKKSLSEIVAYVILITIVLTLSALVYSWLKCYIPGSCDSASATCPEEVSVIVKEYSCGGGFLNITLQNKGLFSADGFIIRVNDKPESTLGVYTLKVSGNGEGKVLKPGESYNYSYSLLNEVYSGESKKQLSKLTFIDVQPFVNKSGKAFCRPSTHVVDCNNLITASPCGFDKICGNFIGSCPTKTRTCNMTNQCTGEVSSTFTETTQCGPCSYSGWQSQTCGGSQGSSVCSLSEILQNRTVISGEECPVTTQCSPNAFCNLISSATAYWKFDEASWSGASGEVKDFFGRINGTAVGGANTVAISDGRAGNLASGSYINLDVGDSNLVKPIRNISYGVWISNFPTNPPKDSGIISTYSVAPDLGYRMTFDDNGNVSFCKIASTNGISNFKMTINSLSLDLSHWTFLMCTYDGKYLKIYVNGALINNVSSSSYRDLIYNEASPIFGSFNNINPSGLTGARFIDDVIIFNKTLSETEVRDLYQGTLHA